MQITFSEDGKNQEEVAFVKAVIQGLMGINEGKVMTLAEATKDLVLVDGRKRSTMDKFM